MSLDRTGLLIIRAWVERGSSKPLRAQIRLTTDVAAGFDRELTFADVAGVSVAVETWLGDVLAAGQLSDNARRADTDELSVKLS